MRKIISYNLNGIRAAERRGLLDWIKAVNADILCFQEIKAMPDQFDVSQYEKLGYHCYWYPSEKKGYSGVAILSKTEAKSVKYGIGHELFDFEGRVITAEFDEFTVMSTYHPSGSSSMERLKIKFEWMEAFKSYIDQLKKQKLIISGDFNICKEAIDIHNPKANIRSSGFLPEERAWLGEFIKSGFEDSFRVLNGGADNYTWWSYRTKARERNLGWRIDYHLITSDLIDNLERAVILKEAYHSDHAPILIELSEF